VDLLRSALAAVIAEGLADLEPMLALVLLLALWMTGSLLDRVVQRIRSIIMVVVRRLQKKPSSMSVRSLRVGRLADPSHRPNG
jgi:hypothetical protein